MVRVLWMFLAMLAAAHGLAPMLPATVHPAAPFLSGAVASSTAEAQAGMPKTSMASTRSAANLRGLPRMVSTRTGLDQAESMKFEQQTSEVRFITGKSTSPELPFVRAASTWSEGMAAQWASSWKLGALLFVAVAAAGGVWWRKRAQPMTIKDSQTEMTACRSIVLDELQDVAVAVLAGESVEVVGSSREVRIDSNDNTSSRDASFFLHSQPKFAMAASTSETMSRTKIREQFRAMSNDEIHQALADARKDLFNYRMEEFRKNEPSKHIKAEADYKFKLGNSLLWERGAMKKKEPRKLYETLTEELEATFDSESARKNFFPRQQPKYKNHFPYGRVAGKKHKRVFAPYEQSGHKYRKIKDRKMPAPQVCWRTEQYNRNKEKRMLKEQGTSLFATRPSQAKLFHFTTRDRTRSAFAGNTTPLAAQSGVGLRASTAMFSMSPGSRSSMYNLWFRSKRKDPLEQKKRARREMRNRSYILFQRNRIKKVARKLRQRLKWVQEVVKDEEKLKKIRKPGDPDGFQWFRNKVYPTLTEACLIIDEVVVNRAVWWTEARPLKKKLFETVLNAAVKMGFMERPPEGKFRPWATMLKFEIPIYRGTPEPRPWQLPGWKSPWMKYREYMEWLKNKKAEEAVTA